MRRPRTQIPKNLVYTVLMLSFFVHKNKVLLYCYLISNKTTIKWSKLTSRAPNKKQPLDKQPAKSTQKPDYSLCERMFYD